MSGNGGSQQSPGVKFFCTPGAVPDPAISGKLTVDSLLVKMRKQQAGLDLAVHRPPISVPPAQSVIPPTGIEFNSTAAIRIRRAEALAQAAASSLSPNPNAAWLSSPPPSLTLPRGLAPTTTQSSLSRLSALKMEVAPSPSAESNSGLCRDRST